MSSAVSSRRKKIQKSTATEVKNVENLGLHDRLEEHHLLKIYHAFIERDPPVLDRKQLEKVLHDIAKITYEENEFEILFVRINIKRDGLVTWDEFISHLILGFQEKEVSIEFQSLEPPIFRPPRLLRSNHRHPVNRITFCPTLKLDGSYSYADGSYLTCSKDGVINYWSLDMQLDRTVQSTCPELKVQQTWVLDLICLPDVSVVCTSSSERDLRFYDTSARKFELRIMISSLEDAVCCMHYEFSQDVNEESKLILGDMGGNVRVLMFSPVGRGPFKSQPGIPLLHVRYEPVGKGLVSGFRVVEFKSLHTDWVRQVSYYKSLHCFVSCAACSKAAVIMKDITESKGTYLYKIPKGAWCFEISEKSHVIATGGPDCLVRVWNPFVPNKPNAIFLGHHAGIVAIVLQDSGKKLFSLAKDKCIKVWDVIAQTCLQTYTSLPPELGEYTDFTILYNPDNRQLLLGSVMIVVLHLCPKQSGEHTDGNTHSLGVSVVLYNPLFKVVLTCGLDSFIIVWDPWNGRRMSVVKEAHTRLLHGEQIPVEITAATFDPGNQLLLTGAGDGSLKMWNFNTGTCLRNMSIEPGCEITSVVWIQGRILAIGWNRHITEFADSGGAAGPGGAFAKPWDTRHTEDVLCAAARIPQTLATSTYNGELVLWRLETGQPYKRYNVANPTGRIRIQHKIEKDEKPRPHSRPTGPAAGRASRSGSIFGRKMSVTTKSPVSTAATTPTSQISSSPQARARRISIVHVPETCVPLRGLAVHSMLFLSSRKMRPATATLLVAVENGSIQVWSHHPAGGFITSFSAIHTAGDYVISMATDRDNEYLFTGTTAGYIKTWLMKGFYPFEQEHVCMPKYRLIFPFMWKDLIEGRAKRANRNQPKPVLLSSHKAHMMPVSGLSYINEAKILISCSADCSARMWTLGGRYLGTLGTFKPWIPIKIDTPPGEGHEYKTPPDIFRMASSTTFKVYMGGKYERRLTKKQEQQAEQEMTKTDLSKGSVYGKRLEAPVLGNYYKLPERTTGRHDFTLDTSFAYIPVYQHLIMPAPCEMPRPQTPEAVAALRYKKEKLIAQRASRGSLRSAYSVYSSKVKY
ncbi:hypothetical protein ILUMI_25755 [Ignelater luminosus]|uniref:WD repeat-containing protein on Y chromosome n=1 Tax=Ignelater luminosus TaxID=2038154 RepID=A0A8K0C7V3_IGNLU|nr:hypothetical protein ILUMI_25755 [Ignelater luminosus]